MSQTDFGYRRVSAEDKPQLVRSVFESVAPRYDLMNDLMSFGVHRLWKRLTALHANVRPGQRVLDLAGGTGDLAALLAPRVGCGGAVVVADISAAMLRRGRDRLIDRGQLANVHCVQADAEQLPFRDASFDCLTIGFGLRNVTHKERALAAMLRVLRPGGRALVLEFSRPASGLLGGVYDAYSFAVLPRLGKLVAGDADSYRYLAESIRRHPGQEELKSMMEAVGFARVDYLNFSGGIVALHRGYKI